MMREDKVEAAEIDAELDARDAAREAVREAARVQQAAPAGPDTVRARANDRCRRDVAGVRPRE